jgi:hypothetical protein
MANIGVSLPTSSCILTVHICSLMCCCSFGSPLPPIMSTEVQKDIQLEIAHVLFIDIVGYSKLLITDQSEQLQKLKEIVRGTEQFRRAEAEGKLLRLPSFLVW